MTWKSEVFQQPRDVSPIIWPGACGAIESPFDTSVGGMYLRFVTTRVHKDSHKPEGVFAAAYALLDSGDLTRDEWKVLREMLNWCLRMRPDAQILSAMPVFENHPRIGAESTARLSA